MTLAEATDRYEKEIIPYRHTRQNSRGPEMLVPGLIRGDELLSHPLFVITL